MVKWARQVLIIEQNIPLKERIVQQKNMHVYYRVVRRHSWYDGYKQ